MTRWDKGLLVLVMIVSVLLIIPIMANRPEASQGYVQVKNKEVLRFDLNEDKDYEVEGSLGPVNIEVKDGSVRVTQENSPHHYCSRQGWVSDSAVPIVCLPNETVIRVEGSGNGEDTVIQ